MKKATTAPLPSDASAMPSSRLSANVDDYNKMEGLEHVLKRPDTWIGSCVKEVHTEYVCDTTDDLDFSISAHEVHYADGLLRIFVEQISNVIDNCVRSRKAGLPTKEINITINRATHEITIRNDGLAIPVELHPKTKGYVHSMIFGELFSGSNYDDTQERETSGRNGIGGKATNVFSKKFTVKGCDGKKSFTQTWTNNLSSATKPVVTICTSKPFTEISYIADLARFQETEYTDDIIRVYKKYIVEMAMLTGVNVVYNDIPIQVKTLLAYSELFPKTPAFWDGEDADEATEEGARESHSETQELRLHVREPNYEVVITPSSQYEVISYANGIYTRDGGVHVDAIIEAFFRPIQEKLVKKDDKSSLTIREIKNCFRVFLHVTVPNPAFEGQSKHTLKNPAPTIEVKKTVLNAFLRWPIVAYLKNLLMMKDTKSIQKLERKARGGFVNIPDLIPADDEGKKNSFCTLILVEGKSASSYPKYGIASVGVEGKLGFKTTGLYPLRGKLLNCKTSPEKIAKNKVIGDIIKILNLRIDADYTKDSDFNSLRYKRIKILTDADQDGTHISCLIMNAFGTLYPTLFRRPTPFITSMQTPIARVGRGKNPKWFYSERQFHEYMESLTPTQKKATTVKYFKGLGSLSDNHVKDTFEKKTIEFVAGNEDDITDSSKTLHALDMAFRQDSADRRKTWIEKHDPKKTCIDWKNPDQIERVRVCMGDYISTELVRFSLYSCERALPNIMDGLKPSQRKLLYSALSTNLKESIRTSQVVSVALGKTCYHHGENSMVDTLVGMAQAFIGSNNIPLFTRDGMFGTRFSGGKDVAQARYISTCLENIARKIFVPDDDNYLKYLEDDGVSIEPEWYAPIVPMVLINGCTGIGTGWSVKIPNHNPLDVVRAIRTWLELDGKVFEEEPDGSLSCLLPEMQPWYRGWTGVMTPLDSTSTKYSCSGVVTRIAPHKVRVTELPINVCTEDFIDRLKSLQEDGKIIEFSKEKCNPVAVDITITESEKFTCDLKTLKLTSSISRTNMVLFSPDGKITKYSSIEHILDEYAKVRLALYVKRKEKALIALRQELTKAENKMKFIQGVLDGVITLFKDKQACEESIVLSQMDSCGITDKEGLMDTPAKMFTATHCKKLLEAINTLRDRITTLENTPPKQIWLNELVEFEKAYAVFLRNITEEEKEFVSKK